MFFIYGETTIITENSIIEIGQATVLVVCLLHCAQYAMQSHVKQGRYFWLASVLIFFSVIRRELNHLSASLVPSDFIFLGYSYDWWEDIILLVIIVIVIGLLVYTWRYFRAMLRHTPIWLYLSVAVLALLQYMGENAIVFPDTVGVVVEELTESITYSMVLIYLWRFKLIDFEGQLASGLGSGITKR